MMDLHAILKLKKTLTKTFQQKNEKICSELQYVILK